MLGSKATLIALVVGLVVGAALCAAVILPGRTEALEQARILRESLGRSGVLVAELGHDLAAAESANRESQARIAELGETVRRANDILDIYRGTNKELEETNREIRDRISFVLEGIRGITKELRQSQEE